MKKGALTSAFGHAYTGSVFSRDITLLAASNFVWIFAFGLYSNFFPIFIKSVGGDELKVSLISSIPLFAGILAIPGGQLAGSVDRKKLLLAGWAVTIPSPLIWAFSDSWQAVLAGQALYSLTYICIPALSLYILEYQTQENKLRAYQMVFMMASAGSIAAPATGGWLLNAMPMKGLLFVVFGLYSFSTLLLLFISRQPVGYSKQLRFLPDIRSIRQSLQGRRLVPIILFFSLLAFSQNIAEPYLSLYFTVYRNVPEQSVGLGFTALVCGATLFIWIISRVQGKISAKNILFVCITLFAASALTICFFSSFASAMPAFFVRGINRSLFFYTQAVFAVRLPSEDRGVAFAVFVTVRSLFTGLAYYPGSALYSLDPGLPLLAEAVLSFALIAALFLPGFKQYMAEVDRVESNELS